MPGKVIHKNACLKFLHSKKGNHIVNSGLSGSQSKKGNIVRYGIHIVKNQR